MTYLKILKKIILLLIIIISTNTNAYVKYKDSEEYEKYINQLTILEKKIKVVESGIIDNPASELAEIDYALSELKRSREAKFNYVQGTMAKYGSLTTSGLGLNLRSTIDDQYSGDINTLENLKRQYERYLYEYNKSNSELNTLKAERDLLIQNNQESLNYYITKNLDLIKLEIKNKELNSLKKIFGKDFSAAYFAKVNSPSSSQTIAEIMQNSSDVKNLKTIKYINSLNPDMGIEVEEVYNILKSVNTNKKISKSKINSIKKSSFIITSETQEIIDRKLVKIYYERYLNKIYTLNKIKDFTLKHNKNPLFTEAQIRVIVKVSDEIDFLINSATVDKTNIYKATQNMTTYSEVQSMKNNLLKMINDIEDKLLVFEIKLKEAVD